MKCYRVTALGHLSCKMLQKGSLINKFKMYFNKHEVINGYNYLIQESHKRTNLYSILVTQSIPQSGHDLTGALLSEN